MLHARSVLPPGGIPRNKTLVIRLKIEIFSTHAHPYWTRFFFTSAYIRPLLPVEMLNSIGTVSQSFNTLH